MRITCYINSGLRPASRCSPWACSSQKGTCCNAAASLHRTHSRWQGRSAVPQMCRCILHLRHGTHWWAQTEHGPAASRCEGAWATTQRKGNNRYYHHHHYHYYLLLQLPLLPLLLCCCYYYHCYYHCYYYCYYAAAAAAAALAATTTMTTATTTVLRLLLLLLLY